MTWRDFCLCLLYFNSFIDFPFTINQKHSEKLEHVSWWIIVHGPKYCRRFLTNQKELSAKIKYVSFLCKWMSGKNIRSFTESQSSTRLDHPMTLPPWTYGFGVIWWKMHTVPRQEARGSFRCAENNAKSVVKSTQFAWMIVNRGQGDFSIKTTYWRLHFLCNIGNRSPPSKTI